MNQDELSPYQPRGSQCLNCVHKGRDCSSLPFNTMHIIEKWCDVMIVKCSDYEKETFDT